MCATAVEYVQRTSEGGWRIAGTRVSLDSVVQAYWEGKSPESIVEEFPSLSSELVYGAIAFYLRNKSEVDRYLASQADTWRNVERVSDDRNRPLLARLRARRAAENGTATDR
jgi:uncharacterized protein (DUF433 family)